MEAEMEPEGLSDKWNTYLARLQQHRAQELCRITTVMTRHSGCAGMGVFRAESKVSSRKFITSFWRQLDVSPIFLMNRNKVHSIRFTYTKCQHDGVQKLKDEIW